MHGNNASKISAMVSHVIYYSVEVKSESLSVAELRQTLLQLLHLSVNSYCGFLLLFNL